MISLTAHFIKGLRWNTASTVSVAALELLRLYILLRILSVADFGLFALATIVLFYVDALNDAGFSGAIIHKKKNDPQKLSSLYWLTILFNLVLAVIIYFLATYIAAFFDTPDLVNIIRWISIIFIMAGIGSVYKSVLIKELQFKNLAVINLLSTIVYFIASIYLAMQGFGVYALVYGLLMKAVFENISYVVAGQSHFNLTATMNVSDLSYYFKFGSYQLGERGLNVIRKELDTLLIGKFLGTEILGIYTVMKNLIVRPYTLINPLITNVSLPIMSKVSESKEKLKDIYLTQTNVLVTINCFIYIFLAVFASYFVHFYYGEKWEAFILVFAVLSIANLLVSIANPVGTLIISSGRADKGFYWNLGALAVYIIALSIGVQYDLLQVSIAILVAQVVLFYPNFSFLIKKLSGASFMEYMKSLSLPIALMVLSTVTAFIVVYSIQDPLLALIISFFDLFYYLWITYSEVSSGDESSDQKINWSKKMRKVLHIFNHYLPKTEVWAFNLIDNLKKVEAHVGAKVYLDNLPGKEKFRFVENDLNHIEAEDQVTDWKKNLGRKLYLRFKKSMSTSFEKRIIAHIKSEKIELLHGHFANIGWELLDVKKETGIPLVVSFYGWDYEMLPFVRPDWKEKYKQLFVAVDLILVEGKAGKEILLSMGCDPEKIRIQFLGIPDKVINYKKRVKKEEELSLVQVASFTEKKGQYYTVTAFAKSLETCPNMNLTLIGDERDQEYKSKIISLIQDKSLESKVTILDFIAFDKLEEELGKYQVFIHPSCYAKDRNCEGGAPTILFNAQATGMPIISTLHCDIPSVVVNGASGMLTPEKEIDLLVNSIQSFYSMDNERFQEYTVAAHSHIKENFCVEANAKNLEELYINEIRSSAG